MIIIVFCAVLVDEPSLTKYGSRQFIYEFRMEAVSYFPFSEKGLVVKIWC